MSFLAAARHKGPSGHQGEQIHQGGEAAKGASQRRSPGGTHRRGVTLLEVLLLTATVTILAALLSVSFLESQTRAKVAQVKSDLRKYEMGLEAYRCDFRRYPIYQAFSTPQFNNELYYDACLVMLKPLSTPVAYMSDLRLKDPFLTRLRSGRMPDSGHPYYYLSDQLRDDYLCANYDWRGDLPPGPAGPFMTYGESLANFQLTTRVPAYCIYSNGPSAATVLAANTLRSWVTGNKANALGKLYDPTNGTASYGAIMLCTGDTRGFPKPY